jgi:hypothetical protein
MDLGLWQLELKINLSFVLKSLALSTFICSKCSSGCESAAGSEGIQTTEHSSGFYVSEMQWAALKVYVHKYSIVTRKQSQKSRTAAHILHSS